MEAKNLPDAPSRNTVAEIIGSKYPEQVGTYNNNIKRYYDITSEMESAKSNYPRVFNLFSWRPKFQPQILTRPKTITNLTCQSYKRGELVELHIVYRCFGGLQNGPRPKPKASATQVWVPTHSLKTSELPMWELLKGSLLIGMLLTFIIVSWQVDMHFNLIGAIIFFGSLYGSHFEFFGCHLLIWGKFHLFWRILKTSWS